MAKFNLKDGVRISSGEYEGKYGTITGIGEDGLQYSITIRVEKNRRQKTNSVLATEDQLEHSTPPQVNPVARSKRPRN